MWKFSDKSVLILSIVTQIYSGDLGARHTTRKARLSPLLISAAAHKRLAYAAGLSKIKISSREESDLLMRWAWVHIPRLMDLWEKHLAAVLR